VNPGHQMLEELFTETPPLPGRLHIGVADEHHLPQVLAAHDPGQAAFVLKTPENHPGGQFIFQFRQAHIRLMPAIRRDDAPVSLGGGIDNGPNGLGLVCFQESNHPRAGSPCYRGREAFTASPTPHDPGAPASRLCNPGKSLKVPVPKTGQPQGADRCQNNIIISKRPKSFFPHSQVQPRTIVRLRPALRPRSGKMLDKWPSHEHNQKKFFGMEWQWTCLPSWIRNWR
jgi:hypothetical protein